MSALSTSLAKQLKAKGLPDPVLEFSFHPTRRWRFDFAWPLQSLAVEVEGGTFARRKSRHTSPKGFHDDCVKYNTASLMGWTVLRFTSKDIANGLAVSMIEHALQTRTSYESAS